ncbi:MAG: MoaD/ThiS family protein [Bacteroidia bacterium]
MKVQVKFFGPLVNIAGTNHLQINDVADTASLKKKILLQFPGMERYASIMAVNKQAVNGNYLLNDGDTVVMLPPFSGG